MFFGPRLRDSTSTTPGRLASASERACTRSRYAGDWMSPIAARMICGGSGNVLTIWLSARSWGSLFEKKNVSSTFGFRSTVRRNTETTSAVTPKQASTGKCEETNRLQLGHDLCDRITFKRSLAGCGKIDVQRVFLSVSHR